MSETKCLLTAAEIEAMPGVDKTHFMNPAARRLNKSLGDATGMTGLGVHLIEVPAGALSTEAHVHYFEEECVYVLSGSGVAVIGEERHPIGPGDFLGYRRGGPPHTIQNTGDGPLKCLVAGQRLNHDVVDYPNAKKRLYRNLGLPWNLVDTADISEPNAGRKA